MSDDMEKKKEHLETVEEERRDEITSPLSTDEMMLILDTNMNSYLNDHAIIRKKFMEGMDNIRIGDADADTLQAQTAFLNAAMSCIESPVKMTNTVTKTKSQVDVNNDMSEQARDIATFIRSVHSSDDPWEFDHHAIDEAIDANFDGVVEDDELRTDPTDVSE